MKLSIIIVNYHVKKELFACIESIYASKPQVLFEIIIVDNDERKTIGKDLRKKFSKIVYVSNENRGFGQACNVGIRHAKGEYLFFLNPDTIVHTGAIDNLIHFLQKKKDVGIVAPLLLGTDGKAYQQGTQELTPLKALFSLSFLHKIFPQNRVAKEYLLLDWDRKSIKEVSVAPGTAFMIRKELFEKIGRFDENFFLFFEEFDLCKRIKQAGYKIFITSQAKVSHAWGVSTKQRKDIDTIFQKSRFYYFRKHFGLLRALVTEGLLRFNKYTVMLIGIAAGGLFLRFDSLYQSMPFIGDQGWYYLSARDMALTGNIPLVGIESSHPWLHQGALWTYLLALSFNLLGFSPFVGGYLSILFGMLSIVGMYWLGSIMFSRRVGIIAAMIVATSPLIIASDRMPYHTSIIPFFTIILIYCIYKWIKGNVQFFPLIIASLGLLYNLELATALLGIGTMVLLLYGYLFKKKWARKIWSIKYLVISILAFFLSMLPMLVYDVGHGFPQTAGFVAWLGYKVLLLFGFPPLSQTTHTSFAEVGTFFLTNMQHLIFANNLFISLGILIASVVAAATSYKKVGVGLLLFLNVLLIVGFFVARTPSGAYLPMLFSSLVLMIAYMFDYLLRMNKRIQVIGIIAFLGVAFGNAYFAYSMNAFNTHFIDRLEAAHSIVKQAEGKEYNLVGKGDASHFESFTMNYEYLTWWLGNGPSKDKEDTQFSIEEVQEKIIIKKL